MPRFSTYIGLDVHKHSIVLAAAPADPELPVSKGEKLPNDLPRLLRKLERYGAPGEMKICYEAGPTGYGLVRELRRRGYACEVVAPAKTPRLLTDRVKTDKRDACKLAVFLRSGHLTAIRVPTEEEEALRDLVRAREDIKRCEVNMRRRLAALMLRHGRIWTGTKHNWTKAHYAWLERQRFERRGTDEAKELYLSELLRMTALVEEIDRSIEQVVPKMPQADLIRALRSFKGIDTHTAATIVAEIGDFKRFPTAGKFMSFLGLVPSELSSGNKTLRGPITKAGNKRLRRLLIEAAWANRRSPHVGPDLARRSRGVAEKVLEHRMKAQRRLYKRKWALTEAGKGSRKVTVALARELAGFIWAVGQEKELMASAS